MTVGSSTAHSRSKTISTSRFSALRTLPDSTRLKHDPPPLRIPPAQQTLQVAIAPMKERNVNLHLRSHLLAMLTLVFLRAADATCAQMEKYYLLSHACDFYFEGYFNFPPSLELAENTTYQITVLARDGSPISSIGNVSHCKIFTPNPLSYSGQQQPCPVNFTVTMDRQIQSDKFLQQGGLLGTLQASVVMLYLNNVALDDGTVLTAGDGNTKFLESRRCVAFIRLPDLEGTIRAMKSVSTEFEAFGNRVAEEFLKTMKDVETSLKKALGHDMDPIGATGSGIPFGMFFP